jgi:uncharacterized protein
MGETRYTEAGGFLKIRGGEDPLDATWIHPESYPIARQILADLGFTPADLRDREKLDQLREKLRTLNIDEVAARFNTGGPTVYDIFEALARPGRDPREDRPQPIFRKGVLKLEDLAPGMELKGEVLNVVDFGAFVDVGLKDSGLVHISQMANRYIKSPYDVIAVGDVVSVWVLNVDPDRRRVSLSMIAPGQERRPPGPPPRGVRQPGGDRPPQTKRARPPFPPPPQGQPQQQRQFGPRPGGPAPQPRGPRVAGWRGGPKPPQSEGQPAAPQPQTPPPPRKPARPRPAPKLSDTQKVGKEPVYSFAQLAALLTAKAVPPAEEPKPAEQSPPAEATEEPKPEQPPAEASAPPAAEAPPPETPPT